jgi:hypothetical protein
LYIQEQYQRNFISWTAYMPYKINLCSMCSKYDMYMYIHVHLERNTSFWGNISSRKKLLFLYKYVYMTTLFIAYSCVWFPNLVLALMYIFTLQFGCTHPMSGESQDYAFLSLNPAHDSHLG